MAKAVFAAHGVLDPRVAAELAALRARVARLEAENTELRALTDEVAFPDPVISLSQTEPALA